jgi:hypothetical protein
MSTAIGRTVLTGLILGLGVLVRPAIAESPSPVDQPDARSADPSREHERAGGGHQFVPPGWTMYAPASPDDLFMRPDQGDGLIEITCSPMRAGPDPAAYVADWESSRVGPSHLLLKKRTGGMVHFDGDLAYKGVYEGDGVLAKVLFVRISERMCGFLGYFLRDDFDRGDVTLNRLVERFRATLDDRP